MKKKNFKINLVILVLVVIIVQVILLKDNFTSVAKYILQTNYVWIFFACLFMFLNLFFQTIAQHKFLQTVKPEYKFTSCFKLIMIGQLMNAITPFSSGGQPIQVYLLNKEGVKVSDSVNTLMQNFIIYQIALIFLATIAILINNAFGVMPKDSFLRKLVIIGYLINTLIIFVLLFISRAKKANTKLFTKIFNFIFGFRFIKNKEEKMKKVSDTLDNFYNSTALLKNNKKNTIISFVSNLLSLLCLYMVPLFVFLSLGEANINVFRSIILSAYTYLIGSFVPIPGGTGGLEFCFSEFFGMFANASLVTAAIIIWRFITYYIDMGIGYIVLLFHRGEK